MEMHRPAGLKSGDLVTTAKTKNHGVLRAAEFDRAVKCSTNTVILTIGHSRRTLEEFIALLGAHKVTQIVDVRTVPRSRHNPQFNKESLPDSLGQVGVGYVHLPGLGGLRHPRADSPNGGWRNASFRGYADYMPTPEFEENLEKLIELGKSGRIAIMCAEAVPWRCHRSLIGDALTVRGIRTEDIMSMARRQVHTLTPFARVNGTSITYPAEVAERANVQAEQRMMKGDQRK
jgi:uncharacterized protein (DUF488 family)